MGAARTKALAHMADFCTATLAGFCSAVDISNGLDTGRVIRQMRNYCLGFDDGSINRALRFGNRAVRVLFLFEHTRLLELVQKASKRENWLNVYAPHFFLKSQGDLDAKFFRSGWGGLKEPGVRDLF